MYKTKNKTVLLALTGLFAAIICVATSFLKVPALLGYVHLGDGMIFLAAAFLGPYGIISAALGSAIADILAGYAVYAPITFVIKGLMALITWLFIKKFNYKAVFNIIAFVLCGIVMTGGYFAFECLMYTPTGALAAVPANLIQAAFGVVIGVITIGICKKLIVKINKN